MYGSPSMRAAKDLNLPAYPSTSPFAGGHLKEESASNSNPFGGGGGGGEHQEQQLMNSGLLRYRSAPSSLLAELCDDFLPVRTSCPEPDASMFARFLTPNLQIPGKPPAAAAAASTQERPQFAPLHPPAAAVEGSEASSSGSRMNFHSQEKEPNRNSSVECSYPMAAASMAMEMEQIKSVHGGSTAGSSNLVRHSSSPAGLFSYLNEDNGYPVLRENGAMGNEASRLKNQRSFSSRQNSFVSQISETMGTGSSSEESGSGGGRSYIPGFPANTWENSSLFSGGNTFTENNGINPSELRNGELLQHQFSLPITSSEMAPMENYLQFQDAIPCKIRAKRGCATHPRSIAERVRRTRISERIRKLQELVPNMDKQTNTAEMLDLAISYIKDLQKEVKTLKESRSSCSCSSGKKQEHHDQN